MSDPIGSAHRPNGRRVLLLALIALLCAGIGWYALSPAWTLRQMKAAARAGDADTLAGYIDFPALRASFKEETKARIAAAAIKGDGFSALGSYMASAMLDTMVDSMVTPAGMRAAFDDEKAESPKGLQDMHVGSDDVEIIRDGLSQFRVHPKAVADPQSGMVFNREGIWWKLTGVRLPVHGDDGR